MKRVSAVKYFLVASHTVLASCPVVGKARAREWVILDRTARGWQTPFSDEYTSPEAAIREGPALPNGESLWNCLHEELLEQRVSSVDWSQVHAALGDRGTMFLAFARGQRCVLEAARTLPLDAVVARALRYGKSDLARELCTGRSPEELIPILASDNAEARLIAQLALGVPE